MSYTISDFRGVPSQTVHLSRAQIVPSTPAARESFSNRSSIHAKNIVLTTIAIAMFTVIGFMLFNLIATPEFLVKREINSIVKDYYENYFYIQILNNNSIDLKKVANADDSEAALAAIMDPYIEPGFARLTLRQLTLYDHERHIGAAASLSEYCDLDRTQIKIYPESPFGRQNYRVVYDYSCKF